MIAGCLLFFLASIPYKRDRCQGKKLQKDQTFFILMVDTACGKCLLNRECYPLRIVCTVYFITYYQTLRIRPQTTQQTYPQIKWITRGTCSQLMV